MIAQPPTLAIAPSSISARRMAARVGGGPVGGDGSATGAGAGMGSTRPARWASRRAAIRSGRRGAWYSEDEVADDFVPVAADRLPDDSVEPRPKRGQRQNQGRRIARRERRATGVGALPLGIEQLDIAKRPLDRLVPL